MARQNKEARVQSEDRARNYSCHLWSLRRDMGHFCQPPEHEAAEVERKERLSPGVSILRQTLGQVYQVQ